MQIISSQSHAVDRQPDNYSITPEIGGFPFIGIDIPEHDLWKSPGSLLPLDGFTIEHPTANHFGYCREQQPFAGTIHSNDCHQVTNFPIPSDEWPPNLALDTACDRYRSSTPSLSNPIATLYTPAPQNNFVTPQETLEPERDEEFPFLVSPTSQKKRNRNRVAAAKCRKKAKRGVDDLQQREKDLLRENKMLNAEAGLLREEVLKLRSEIFRHSDCDSDYIRHYIRKSAEQAGTQFEDSGTN